MALLGKNTSTSSSNCALERKPTETLSIYCDSSTLSISASAIAMLAKTSSLPPKAFDLAVKYSISKK